MSSLNFMEKLLDGVAVEWKALGKVLVRTKGTKITAGQMKELHKDGAPLKVFAGGKTVALVDFDDIPAKDVNREPSVIVKSRGIIEFEYYDKPFSHKNEMWSYHSKNGAISIKFVYYFLKLNESHFQSIGGKMQMPQISTPDTDNFIIPIPCPENPKKSLEIQTKIVRILDAFTELTTELTAELSFELTARKKQYNHYLYQLLSSEDGNAEWKTLGDIGDVKMCKRILKNETRSEGDVPFYKIGTFGKQANAFIPREIYESYKEKYSFPRKGDVLISASGTIGRTVIYDGEPAYFQDSNIVWLDNDENIVTNKYLWHFYKIAKWFVSEGGTIDRLYNENIKKTKILVPYPNDLEKSLAEQNRVVAILDKFDALTNSIIEALPHEISLRQKQYEYYRDLLLSFPKQEEVAE
ncbi:MAG: restriction endonuclease subunit S [Gammaproteobacteria bacterium]|nr:restriction endonuclease subunit S [Gammaproteobacteria bacterium]MBU0881963.1 restriction endonuclease subunit S [Gammaproteobacteria bacterium]MBU1858987.1 restriction endonuclease subunit S [Gammaproteobacteria bacterium]